MRHDHRVETAAADDVVAAFLSVVIAPVCVERCDAAIPSNRDVKCPFMLELLYCIKKTLHIESDCMFVVIPGHGVSRPCMHAVSMTDCSCAWRKYDLWLLSLDPLMKYR